MKIHVLGALAAASLALAGCNAPGVPTIDPSVQAEINAAFNAVCDYVPALIPLEPRLSANLQNDIAQAQVICNAGSPTSPVAAGVDILAIYMALEPYFARTAPASKPMLHRIDAGLRAHGLR